MILDRTRFFDEKLPRYTSYPTAPHFNPSITAHDYANWLGTLRQETSLSLYLHVPFCRAMCWYCGCHTTIAKRDDPIADYLAVMRQEIDLVAGHLQQAPDVRHIHFGGGTPTIVSPEDFIALMDLLRHRFAVNTSAEIAVEIDPRTLTPDMIQALGAAGVNRASLGVQSFDPVVQKAINRVQSFEQTEKAVNGLRATGINGVNFDLIYGLPKQTIDSCIETVERCIALQPDRLSVFGYAHVPGFKKYQNRIDLADLPDGPERCRQALAIAEALTDAGYIRIGLDHYARKGDSMATASLHGALRRNFQGYTTDPCEALVGLGASSIGQLPQGFVQNEVALGRYAEAVRNGKLATARGLALCDDDRFRSELIERLMCDLSLDIGEVCARHGRGIGELATSLDQLATLEKHGIVMQDGHKITVPEDARILVRNVASVFDAYLDRAARSFSRAV